MRTPLRLYGAAFVLVWFVWFGWDGLFARFRADDMMNMAGYWTPGVAHSLLANFMIGTNAYRPMGALFYLPLHAAFGLNPLSFRVVIFLLLGVNVYLAYRVALLLDCTVIASGLVALLVCYHAGMGDLHYNTAVVYDILCFFFYSSTLIFYLKIRRQKRALSAREWPPFLLLFLCALNSKEMAVTLPVMLLVYEWIYQRERQWWPALSVGLLTALSIFGKIFGADPLMAQAAYKPVFTLARYFASSTVHLNDLLYTGFFFTPSRALILWFAMALIAWRVRTSPLRFALLFIFISPLPVIFLEGRTRACLYIPLLGWAIFAAVLFDALVTRISRNRAWVRHSLLGAGVVLLAILIQGRKLELMPLYAHEGELTESVIAQFRSLDLQVEPGSSVLLVDDPFVDWDTKFIADLSFRDRSVNVWLQNKNHFSDEEIHEKMKYVFRFENGRLVRLDPITYHSPN